MKSMTMEDLYPRPLLRRTSIYHTSVMISTSSTPLEAAHVSKSKQSFSFYSESPSGIVKSGIYSGAVLKGLIRILHPDVDHEANDRKSSKSRTSRGTGTSGKSNKNKGLRFKSKEALCHLLTSQ